MNTRDAILKAADHIERLPGCYDFCYCGAPQTELGKGCMLAWIAYFMGYRNGENSQDLCETMLGVSSLTFYVRTHYLGSRLEPSTAVKILRAYADKYHPDTEYATPDWNAIATRGDIAMEEA